MELGCDDRETYKGHKRLLMTLQPPSMECARNIGDGGRTLTTMVTETQ